LTGSPLVKSHMKIATWMKFYAFPLQRSRHYDLYVVRWWCRKSELSLQVVYLSEPYTHKWSMGNIFRQRWKRQWGTFSQPNAFDCDLSAGQIKSKNVYHLNKDNSIREAGNAPMLSNDGNWHCSLPGAMTAMMNFYWIPTEV